ncbi:radical SAM protein [uncultured Phascolarctobacterium sp.]|uniref:radical SAM/SPASM domain-containing protein n=1 Tax=Phascolarctobacterium sp. TaxID=2049039 RepID=UPI0025D0FCBD|nr:radical SAM protein [uncultured Phascolarctobacterium sp.]
MKIDYSKILRYYLILNRNCNMSCLYCIQGETAKQNYRPFDYPNPKKVADYFPANGNAYEIVFYGGEAFIYFDYMIEVARCIKERNEKAMFAVTTNGTLLTVERAKILNELQFRVNISHDGDVYEITRRHKDILKSDPEAVLALDKFVFISTITKYNWDYYKVWDYFEEFRLKYKLKRPKVNMMFLKDNGGMTDDSLFVYKNTNFENMLDKVFENLENNIMSGDFDCYEYDCYENLFGKLLKEYSFNNTHSFCAFFDTAMAIDVHGNIYDCHNAINPYGHIGDAKNIDFKNPYIDKAPCIGCEIRNVCAGGCLKATPERRRFICYYLQNEIGRMLKMLNRIVRKVNDGGGQFVS